MCFGILADNVIDIIISGDEWVWDMLGRAIPNPNPSPKYWSGEYFPNEPGLKIISGLSLPQAFGAKLFFFLNLFFLF